MSVKVDSFNEMDRLFRPRAVAVVGASPRGFSYNRVFLDSMRALGFRGRVYAVNPRGEAVDDFPTYPNVSQIPEAVDHVVVAVPAAAVREVLEDIARKRPDSVTVFSSGFSESGDLEGRAREDELRQWLKGQPFRLIGPNCMGIYCPETGLGYRPDFPAEEGSIGYASQSGGMTVSGVLMAAGRGLRFSKVVSYGNEVDVSCPEILNYLALDPKTKLVWLYVEGTRDGTSLVSAMTEVARRKPLLVLKGGLTTSGGRAAASHTGALAGSAATWEGALAKAGAMAVRHLEDLVDATQALQWLPACGGRRLGLLCISGGLSVNYTDQAVQAGFQVPRLSPYLVGQLREIIDLPGTSLNNPLDLAAGFFLYPTYSKLLGRMEESGEIDVLVLILALEYLRLAEMQHDGLLAATVDAILASAPHLKLPLVVVMPPVCDEANRTHAERLLLNARIPVFAGVDRALWALDLWGRNGERRGAALRST